MAIVVHVNGKYMQIMGECWKNIWLIEAQDLRPLVYNGFWPGENLLPTYYGAYHRHQIEEAPWQVSKRAVKT